MLDVIKLDFDYPERRVLNKVSFHLAAGRLLHLKGGNGVGKTTLLKLIAGLHRPAQGDIRFAGQSIFTHLNSYQSQLCYIGHKPGINLKLTIKENCFFDPHYSLDEGQLNACLSLFKLDHHADYPCSVLSAGQKRQVALLRMWFSKASLWLLDEPLTALDTDSIAIILAKIQQHCQEGGSVLLTSHQRVPLNEADYQEYVL